MDKEKIFVYLDNLRDSGITNMFGAAPYIIEEFRVPRDKAKLLLLEWMDTLYGCRSDSSDFAEEKLEI